MNFNELFKQITPEQISESVFALVGRIFPVVTAGRDGNYNSMVASGGGMGVLFKKPVAWCVFPKKRYTLELIKKEQVYTLSYFPDEYREQFMFLGTKSGRESNKMQEVELGAIKTPLRNMSFEEARLIIECKLMLISTPDADGFYSKEAKEYVSEIYKDPGEIREYVFGEMTNVWEKISN
ncbi:MAG: hypothetical protein LBP57_00275 [Endomicrobium sp.]|jgi:flavin reductase (DIM6/NTAB) family NADH-FMN oxidoreductase RutF|nr:hypothetical protein [Endomicrobium sp.]